MSDKTSNLTSTALAQNNGENVSANDKMEEKATRTLTTIIKNFFSRCGVPIASFKISKPQVFNANVNYSLQWRFKCRIKDTPISKTSDETQVLSVSQMEQVTDKNAKELSENSPKTQDFIEHLSKLSFSDLRELSSQAISFNSTSFIGRIKCKSCHGKLKVICDDCKGRGHVMCPVCNGKGCDSCHSTGFIECKTCKGTGSVPCADCKGTGEQIVEREIIYEAECTKGTSFSLKLPDDGNTITDFNEDEQKIITDAANFDNSEIKGVKTDKGFSVSYSGNSKCYGMQVHLSGLSKPFNFILCGDDLKAILKPPVLDYVFAAESNAISMTLSTGFDDINEKIKCVKVVLGKAILAKTLRSVEAYEQLAAKNVASQNGTTVDALLNTKKKNENPRILSYRKMMNSELVEKVSEELKANAHGFVSDDFAKILSKNLIDFVPVLSRINPKTKFIWSAITLGTWLLDFLFMFMMPNIIGILLVMFLSSLICLFTTYGLTKNLVYYSVISALKLTHRSKKIPNLTTEAVQSGRLLIGSLVISIVFVVIEYFGYN